MEAANTHVSYLSNLSEASISAGSGSSAGGGTLQPSSLHTAHTPRVTSLPHTPSPALNPIFEHSIDSPPESSVTSQRHMHTD